MYVRTFHPEVMCWSIPNGSGITASIRLRLSQEGLLAGMPDLMLMRAARHAPGLPVKPGPKVLGLEFKRPDGKGRLSEAQDRALERLKEMGCWVEQVNSLEAAKAVFASWWAEP
jgi:hypothetical protein